MELEELKAEVLAMKIIAEKALNMAIEAKIEIEAMKKSTHRIEYIDPQKLVTEPLKEEPEDTEAPAPAQLSPYATFRGFTERRKSLDESGTSKDIIEDKVEHDAAMWDDAVG